ncbi:MAG: hypothetical protein R6T96_06990 [Longimicrobiales bacterium]
MRGLSAPARLLLWLLFLADSLEVTEKPLVEVVYSNLAFSLVACGPKDGNRAHPQLVRLSNLALDLLAEELGESR